MAEELDLEPAEEAIGLTVRIYQNPADHFDEWFSEVARSSTLDPTNPRRLDPISRYERPVNRLTKRAMEQLVETCMDMGYLVRVTIQTGYAPVSNQEAYLSRYTTTGYGQISAFKGSLAEQELIAWAAAMERVRADQPDLGLPKAAVSAQLSLYHILWRLSHLEGLQSGAPRLLVAGLEVSHRAEAYDQHAWDPHPYDYLPTRKDGGVGKGAWAASKGKMVKYPFHPCVPDEFPNVRVASGAYMPPKEKENVGKRLSAPQIGWRVELLELESVDVNVSRALCANLGLHWYKPSKDGQPPQLITEDNYEGPTCCPHHTILGPKYICYGPRPQPGRNLPDRPEPPAAKRQKRDKNPIRTSVKARPPA